MSTLFSSSLSYYKRLTPERLTTEKDKLQKTSPVAREIEYFKSKAEKTTKVDDFLGDYRVRRFMLTAFNLEKEIPYTALSKKIMKDDASNSSALVNQTSVSQNYKDLNALLDLKTSGMAQLKTSSVIDNIVSRYVASSYENSIKTDDEALSKALYFERNIKNMKNGNNIIADDTMFEVFRTKMRISQGTILQGSDKLKKLIEKNFDFSKVNNSTYIKEFATRYLAIKELEKQPDGTSLNDINLMGSKKEQGLFGNTKQQNLFGSTKDLNLLA